MHEEPFWSEVREVARKAGRAYLATIHAGKPRVRVVYPAFDGRKIWIAATSTSAKARQIARDPNVALCWETGASRPAAHLTVSGIATLVSDPSEKRRVWEAGIFAYNLLEFWPQGSSSADLALIMVEAKRIELGWQPAMWQGQRPEVWKA